MGIVEQREEIIKLCADPIEAIGYAVIQQAFIDMTDGRGFRQWVAALIWFDGPQYHAMGYGKLIGDDEDVFDLISRALK